MVLPEQLSFRTAWPVVLDLVLITSTSSSCGSTPWTSATSYFPPCPVLYVTAVFTVGSLESRQSRHIEERPLLSVALSHPDLKQRCVCSGPYSGIGSNEPFPPCGFGGSGQKHTRGQQRQTCVVPRGSCWAGPSLALSQYRLCLQAAEIAMCLAPPSLDTALSLDLDLRPIQS